MNLSLDIWWALNYLTHFITKQYTECSRSSWPKWKMKYLKMKLSIKCSTTSNPSLQHEGKECWNSLVVLLVSQKLTCLANDHLALSRASAEEDTISRQEKNQSSKTLGCSCKACLILATISIGSRALCIKSMGIHDKKSLKETLQQALRQGKSHPNTRPYPKKKK